MHFIVTPLAMDMRKVVIPMVMSPKRRHHFIMEARCYDRRQSIETDVLNAHAACEVAWTVFQNLDDDHLTPDGGRSLMVGDMVEVTDQSGATSHWMCASMGWFETSAPGKTIQEFIEGAA